MRRRGRQARQGRVETKDKVERGKGWTTVTRSAERCGKDGNVFLRCSPVTYLRTSRLDRWEMGEVWEVGGRYVFLVLPGPSGQVR